MVIKLLLKSEHSGKSAINQTISLTKHHENSIFTQII